MVIAIDFDGTIVENRYPAIGAERPFAIETLRMLLRDHHQLILWTVREGEALKEAVEWCKKRGVEFYAINKDYPEEDITKNRYFSRKLKADCFIDDSAVGGMPSWGEIYQIISQGKTYEEILRSQMGGSLNDYKAPKRKHWWSIK